MLNIINLSKIFSFLNTFWFSKKYLNWIAFLWPDNFSLFDIFMIINDPNTENYLSDNFFKIAARYIWHLLVITSDKMHFKILVIYMIFCVSLTSSFSVDLGTLNPTEVSQPRTIKKSFKLLYNLFKMFYSIISSSNDEKKFMTNQRQMIPYNGMNYKLYDDNRRVEAIDRFPTLQELNKEEGIVDNKVKDMMKKEEPQFWLFDKFSKKTDLVLLTKILLKLIIFKKIVKFIALVCLLFFIPALKDENADTDDKKDARNFDIYGKMTIY